MKTSFFSLSLLMFTIPAFAQLVKQPTLHHASEGRASATQGGQMPYHFQRSIPSFNATKGNMESKHASGQGVSSKPPLNRDQNTNSSAGASSNDRTGAAKGG